MLSLAKLKLLLGVKEGTREVEAPLQFVLDDVTATICSYCNLTELPEALETIAYRMACDVYRAEGYGHSDAPVDVTSIKEGDTQTNFARANTEAGYTASLLKSYTTTLNRYRKVARECCCKQ